jgi:cytochrome bd ubiquinol oxidase subunit I
MEPLALLLSRLQFAFTIAYHIIFPTLSMGLAVFLMVLRALELKTGQARWREAGIFWSRIFALSFGMGVVSGVVLSYEIGTNWGRFSELAGPVVGPLMSYEVLSAFFLEAGFLGIVLFGRNRVGPRLHFFATCMVALGTLMSAFWILSANSFMHTPAGYHIANGVLQVQSWTQVVFNPSFPYRFAHMVSATYLTTSFVVIAVGAWHVLRKQHAEFGALMLKFGLGAAAVLAPLQVLLGDLHGLNTLEHQPMKVAAMEGHWETAGEVPLLLFAWPDQAQAMNHFELKVPKLGSVILTHDPQGVVRGLNEVPPQDRPPVAIVFWSFRIMVGCGLVMLALTAWGLLRWWRGRLAKDGIYLRLLLLSGPLGFIAVLAGWVTTEVGRQPWVVHGVLRTEHAASIVPTASVAASLTGFILVYGVLFYAFARFFAHLVRKGPQSSAAEPAPESLRAFLVPDEKA